MAKDRRKLQHIHSSIADKQPTPQTLEVGEIAVNNSKDQEFLSIKNTEDKVVRFSSDAQMIEWTERKEVMPYEGYTRGSEGPDGSTGPDSVTNDDLLQNKSNLIIKLNQVAASATTKHDVVNGAKDIYNKEVNPTTDGGVTDGAGFAIDMSRYAMIDANPSFSSLTVTVQTELSGNTTISDGANTNEYGTDSGHTLTIETTDVVVNDTNWVEEITNKESKITTLDESATTRTTVIGTEDLNVSGTTTEVHEGNVTITNESNVVESTSGNSYNDVKLNYSGKTDGTTTEIKVGDVIEENQSNKTETTTGIKTENASSDYRINVTGATIENKTGGVSENNLSTKTENTTGLKTENNEDDYVVNTTGDTKFTTTGNTAIHSDGNVGISAKGDIGVVASENNINITANKDICETAGVNASFFAVTKTNLGLNCDDSSSSTTTNVYGSTINENADTVNNTIGTANTTIVSANTNITTETTVIDAANTNITTDTTVISTANTTITSANTNITTSTTVIGVANTSATTGTLSGNTLTIDESTSISAKTPTTYISGSSLEVKETNVNISGNTTLSGDVTIGGDLVIPITCSTITSTTVNDALCEVLSRDGITMTRVDAPDDSRLSAIYRIYQNGVQVGDGTNAIDINVPKDGFLKEVKLVEISGISYLRFTWNVYDAETQTYSTGSTDVNVEDLVKQIEANNPSDNGTAVNHNVVTNVWYNETTGKMNASAETTPTMHVTNLYATTNISGTNITASAAIRANNVSANTISAATSVTTKDLTATSNETVGGTLNVSGASTINGVLTIPSGISKKLTWASGTFTADTTGYNGSADKVITVPTSTAHLTKSTLTISYGNIYTGTKETSYNTETAKTITIPDSLSNVSNGNAVDSSPTNTSGKITIKKNLEVSGTVTATGAIYSSDRNLKENISFVKSDDRNKVGNVFFRSFNFKDDDTKRKTYGVIAQEVQEAGLDELVHVKDDGMLGVDYTSLFALKCAYLENFCGMLNERITQLEEKVRQLEENKK